MSKLNGMQVRRDQRLDRQFAMTARDAIMVQAVAIVEQDRSVTPRLADISSAMATAIMAVLIDRGVDGFGQLSDYFWAYGRDDDEELRSLYEQYEGPHPFRDLWQEDPTGKLVLNFSLAPYRHRHH